MIYPKHTIILLSLLTFNCILLPISAKETIKSIYVSPPPGAKHVQKENNIIIRFSKRIGREEFKEIILRIQGNIREEYQHKIKLLKDNKTLIIKPIENFQPGEKIQVSLKSKNSKILKLEELDFHFKISRQKRQSLNAFISDNLPDNRNTGFPLAEKESRQAMDYIEKFELPQDFPPLVIGEKSNPNPGYFLMSCIGPAKYNIIVDNNITPIYYQKYNERIMGLDVQQANGYLTFSKGINNTFIELDSTYKQRRTYTAGNGYFTDFHELLITEDSTYWLMIYDPQLVDMSQVIEGGNPNAIVIGLVIQELNQDDEVIFQWRSWDHFDILDCDTNQVNLYGLQVDYVHGNALDLTHDGNILISSRHLNEITKINRETGEIIWRMGGKENEFSLIGDNLWFTDQHGIREINADSISLFDNGNYHDPKFSRGVEYAIDEEAMELTFIREYRHDPDIIVSTMGMMQREAGKNAVIGWSRPSTEEVITEYHLDGSVAIEILCPNFSLPTYRVFKREWESKLFEFDNDSIDFGSSTAVGDSLEMNFTVINPGGEEVIIHKCFSSSPAFKLLTNLPQTLAAGQQLEMTAQFKPAFNTNYVASLTLSTDTDTSRIAKQLFMKGATLHTGIHSPPNSQIIRIFPNPAAGSKVRLTSTSPMRSIELFDAKGLLLKKMTAPSPGYHEVYMDKFERGMYVLRVIFADDTILTEKIIN